MRPLSFMICLGIYMQKKTKEGAFLLPKNQLLPPCTLTTAQDLHHQFGLLLEQRVMKKESVLMLSLLEICVLSQILMAHLYADIRPLY